MRGEKDLSAATTLQFFPHGNFGHFEGQSFGSVVVISPGFVHPPKKCQPVQLICRAPFCKSEFVLWNRKHIILSVEETCHDQCCVL